MTVADVATLIRFLTNTDSTSLTNGNLLVIVNAAQERISGRILAETAGGRWKWGDINYTALPTYTMNLTAGTQFYQIDSLTGPIMILGCEVADQNGDFHLLNPITLDEIHAAGFAQSTYMSTNGRPIEYEKREHGVVVYPAPDNGVSVTLSGGLRIFFLRGMSAITDMTSTTVIGFPLPWHDFLGYDGALVYAMANNLSNVNQLRAERDKREKELLSFISRRNQDDRPIMTPKFEPYF